MRVHIPKLYLLKLGVLDGRAREFLAAPVRNTVGATVGERRPAPALADAEIR